MRIEESQREIKHKIVQVQGAVYFIQSLAKVVAGIVSLKFIMSK